MTVLGLLLLLAAFPLAALEIRPDDPRLEYSGFVSKTFVEGTRRNYSMKFSRLIPHPDHLEHDSPGGRIRFKTDSRSIRVKVRYNGLHHPDRWRAERGCLFYGGQPETHTVFPERCLFPDSVGWRNA